MQNTKMLGKRESMSKLELYNIYAGYEESKPVLKDISFFVENTPFLVFLFRQNIKKFPFDIIKAARLDGASDARIFFRLCIPYLKPVFISAFIITFFESWNSILIPVVIIQSSEKFTNSIYLNSIGSIWFSDYGVLMASLLISTLPTLISFLIFRHYIKRGIYYHDK